jgi:hypothetical protein
VAYTENFFSYRYYIPGQAAAAHSFESESPRLTMVSGHSDVCAPRNALCPLFLPRRVAHAGPGGKFGSPWRRLYPRTHAPHNAI